MRLNDKLNGKLFRVYLVSEAASERARQRARNCVALQLCLPLAPPAVRSWLSCVLPCTYCPAGTWVAGSARPLPALHSTCC